jgi:hypothetical protein
MDTSIGRGGVRRVGSLGIVDLVTDGVARPVPGPRRRALLVVLALAMGEVVSTGRLIDIVWNGHRRRDQGWISSAGLIGERRLHCAANRSTPCRR